VVCFFKYIPPLETAELLLKIYLALCNIPLGKSVHITSIGIQNEIFIKMTILRPSFNQIHELLMACW